MASHASWLSYWRPRNFGGVPSVGSVHGVAPEGTCVLACETGPNVFVFSWRLTKYLIDQVLADQPQPFITDPIMPKGREERVA